MIFVWLVQSPPLQPKVFQSRSLPPKRYHVDLYPVKVTHLLTKVRSLEALHTVAIIILRPFSVILMLHIVQGFQFVLQGCY